VLGAGALARALLAGGRVTWDDGRPRLAVPADWTAPLREHTDEVRDVLDRAATFRAQITENDGRRWIPVLVIPGTDRSAGCFSCGAPCRLWRCLVCAVAVYIALDVAGAGLAALVETHAPAAQGAA